MTDRDELIVVGVAMQLIAPAKGRTE